MSADDITAIDRWVETVAAHWGESERTVFGARLCIAELACNVLEHGVAKSGSDHIIVTIRHLGDGIGIEFLDSRAAFDPTAKANATASATKCGGRGLKLLHAYADELSYCHDGTYNRVKLKIKSV